MIFMFTSQIVNYLFPLFLVPYLIKVLGLKLYGVYVIFQIIIFFGILLTSYSYNVTGVKRISNNLTNANKMQIIFNNIISTRILLAITVLCIFSLAPIFSDKIAPYKTEYYFILINILGYAIFPDWYIQGIGKFKMLMKLNIIYKSIQFFAIIFFVKTKNDFLILNIIYGFIPLLMSIHALYILNISKLIFNFQNILIEIKDNFKIFLSLLFRNANSSLIILYIGMRFQLDTVAVIGALDKIVKAVRGMFDPVFNVMFQYINKKDQKINKLVLIHKMLSFAIVFGILFMLMFNIYRVELSNFLFNGYKTKYDIFFLIFSIMPMLLILTNIFGIQTLLTYNYKEEYNKIMFYSFIITLSSLLIFNHNIYILLLVIPLVELFILINTFLYYRRIKKHENNKHI